MTPLMPASSQASPTVEPRAGSAPVAFIGGGNMARALVGGLLRSGVAPEAVHLAEPRLESREALVRDWGIATHARNRDAASAAATWVLAVKPQVMQAVCLELSALAQSQRPLILSIAAGVRSDQIERWLGGAMRIVRAMPNTPALLGAGASALYAGPRVDADGRDRAEVIMRAAGIACWVDKEEQLDAVTALSGSGPAYFFLLVEAMAAEAIELGLEPPTARLLAEQTCLGAGRMLRESDAGATTLRERVTSPGGTTAAALEVFRQAGFAALVARALRAAADRAAELSTQADSSP